MRYNNSMARPAALALLLSCAVFPSASAITCKSPPMTMQEYRDIMESEMEAEFLELQEEQGLTTEQIMAAVKPVWDNANVYELSRSFEEESSTGKPFPYIICHLGPDMSTNKRKKALKAALSDALVTAKNFTSANVTEYLEGIQYVNIATSDTTYCGITRLHASVACEMKDEDYIRVQPMIMSLKMSAGTVSTILDRFADTTDQFTEDPSADFTLCPGASAEDKLAEKDIVTQSGSDDITAAFIGFLMDRGENFTCGDTDGESAASKNLYWTDSSSPTFQEQVAITKRTLYWAELFKRSINTCACDEMYTTRLRVTLTHGDKTIPNDPDILNVLFDRTDATQADTDCAIALVAAGALLPETCGVEVRGVVETGNQYAQWLSQSGTEGYTPLFESGLTGKGQVVAVSDTGLDVDNCYFWDTDADEPTAARNDGHRKVVQYNDFVDKSDYKNGHGTHVCGTIAGRRAEDGKAVSRGVADGVAYDAKLAFLDIGDADGNLELPLRDTELLSTGRGTGDSSKDAHIHSASWGGSSNSYTGQARNFDNYMYKNPDFLAVVAAGNSGRDGLNTVGTPATAKNIISVGAHNSIQSASGGLGPSHVSDFSSRGPTSDGRMKPDILAPGKYLVSAGADPFATGNCDDGSGDLPGLGQSSPGLMSMAGTSMATPAVSGTAALVRQYLAEGWYKEGTKGSGDGVKPSGALVKAILMNGAQWMKGADNGRLGSAVTEYDENQGFGRISLIDSIYIANKTSMQMSFFEDFVDDGGKNTYNVTIDKSGGCKYSELRATLVWTEPGSQSGCKFCLINDLDLLITKMGDSNAVDATYYPNGLSGRDRTNNAERVIVEKAEDEDNFIVTVSGTNLESDKQSYAIVLTGCFGGSSIDPSSLGNSFEGDTSDDDRRKYILMGVGAGVVAILLCICCVCCMKKRK